MKSTGIPTVDVLLRGGFGSGIVDLYGEPSAGKSAFGASLLKQASLEGRPALLVYTTALDKEFYLGAGVPRSLDVMSAGTWGDLEKVLPEILVRSENLLVVIDSATALESLATVDMTLSEATDKQNVSAEAAEKLETIAHLRAAALSSDSTVVLISEARSSFVGGRVRSALGKRCYELVSTSLQFSVVEMRTSYGRLDVRKVRIDVKKNAYAPPTGSVEVSVYNDGIRKYYELLKRLIQANKVEQRGSYWVLRKSGIMLGPGYAKAAEQLEAYAKGSSDGGQEG